MKDRLATMLRRVAAEPLARFAVLGAALFALAGALSDGPAERAPDEAIVLDAAGAARLAAQFEATWRRAPTPEELERLMQGWVEEEVMVREARSLGLDRGDAVVRQRLHQKMLFFAETGADAAEPDDAELRAHLAANPDRFAVPARATFEQAYLGEAPEDGRITEALEALAAGADPDAVGLPTLLPHAMRSAPARAVDGAFGAGFFEQAAALAPGVWGGPVRSSYGVHLVRVVAFVPARTPELDEVRDLAAEDWRASRAEASRARFVETLIARRRIETPDAAEVLRP